MLSTNIANEIYGAMFSKMFAVLAFAGRSKEVWEAFFPSTLWKLKISKWKNLKGCIVFGNFGVFFLFINHFFSAFSFFQVVASIAKKMHWSKCSDRQMISIKIAKKKPNNKKGLTTGLSMSVAHAITTRWQ